MSQLLNHATSMTRHRDHALVNAALVLSLVDLLGTNCKQLRIRLYTISHPHGEQPEVVLAATGSGRSVEHADLLCAHADLAPQLLEALASQASVAAVPAHRGDPHCFWLPAIFDRTPLACIELESNRPLTQSQIISFGGISSLYVNYLSLLNYSQVDTLTQLLNRKTFDDSLDRILSSNAGYQTHLAVQERRNTAEIREDWLAVIDIDHFKHINDRLGHLFGDQVLVQLADTMRHSFRRHDKLFRFGGEEFVVILRHTAEQRVFEILDRFRSTVGRLDISLVGQVTVSIGFTRIRSPDKPSNLLGRADSALYYAKRHGRNQVRSFETLVSAGRLPPHADDKPCP